MNKMKSLSKKMVPVKVRKRGLSLESNKDSEDYARILIETSDEDSTQLLDTASVPKE